MKLRRLTAGRIVGLIGLLLCCRFLPLSVSSATVLSGNVSGTWTTNQSPYLLIADCTVATNQILTINPGVEVIIGPSVNLFVNGGIVALGTPQQPIRIHGASSTNYWNVIEVNNSGATNRFAYCQISDGNGGLFINAIGVRGSNIFVHAEIINCDFFNCTTPVGVSANGISANGVTGGATVTAEIHNCVFDTCGNGCNFSAASPPGYAAFNARVSGNVFRNVRGWVMTTGGYATNSSQAVFLNNTVVGAQTGVHNEHNNLDVSIRNNIFAGVTNAVYRAYSVSSTPDVSYNCFFSNTVNFVNYPGLYGVPVINNHKGDPCDAFYNIFLDPQALATNRYLLSDSSPCIDAGDPTINDVCFNFSKGTAISDIGAYGGPDACNWLTHGFQPVIDSISATQTSCVGETADFEVHADGATPLSYQWFLNMTNLLVGETNAQLHLSNLHTNQAGLYSAMVSNPFASTRSPPVQLVVLDECVEITEINLYAGLTISGLVGKTYSIDCTTNAADGFWTPVATNTLTQPTWLWIDTNTPFNPLKIFRARALP